MALSASIVAILQVTALAAALVRSVPLRVAAGIVGRAACRDRVHLLTRRGDLVEFPEPGRPVFQVYSAPELAAKSELWGLACLADGSLWTLETGHSLARVSRDGRVVGRTALQLPWMAVFGVGDHLVYQTLPIVVGSPVLATATPSTLDSPHPWPGLTGRSAAGNLPSAARNLLRCGIASAGLQPCWFIDQPTIVIAGNASARAIEVPAADLAAFDREMPLWDAAAADATRLWVLATSSPANGHPRRADVVLLLRDGRPAARIRLPRPARLFLFASPTRCMLLLDGGDFAEVTTS